MLQEQIQSVLETAPDGRQVMLFSATMPPHIKAITRQYMHDAVTIDITANQRYKAPESVKHLVSGSHRQSTCFVTQG